MLVGDSSTVTKCEVVEHFGNSDHRMIVTEISCPVPRVNLAPRKVYLYSKGDYEGLNEDIKSTDWEEGMNHPDIEQNWSFFKNQYNGLLDEYVPHKMVKPGQRHSQPWVRYKSVKKS